MKLNKQQLEAVGHVDGPCIVTACPGSGKTFVLTERTCSLIEKGVSPKNLLCLTFTNKAAKEMSSRICKKLKTKKPGFFIGTFHSLCANFLRKVGHRRGYSKNFTILDEYDQKDTLIKLGREVDLDINAADAGRIAYVLNYYRDQLEESDFIQNNLDNPAFIEIAERYLEKCKRDNLADFSALIFETIKILEDNKDIRDKVQDVFKYVLVDETQDTNQSQFHLINLLGGKHKNIMIVADQDQSIYRWRGARPENIQQFIDTHKGCRTITLSKNYRSTPQIIEPAAKLIRHNISHEKKQFETDNKNGQPVRCYEMPNQVEEAQWLARWANKLKADGGWDYNDMVVLYRMNKMSEPVEQSLAMENIPYEVIGSGNFYDRKEVKYCLSMLKLTVNPLNNIAFARICDLVPGLGNVTISKIEKRAAEKDINLIQSCGELSNESTSENIRNGCQRIDAMFSSAVDTRNPSGTLDKLVKGLDLKDYMSSKRYADTATERIENIDQVIESAATFNGQEDAVQKYLQRVALVTANDKETDGDKITLMTFHAAKGLEFPVVFMIGVEQGILPHERSIADDPVSGVDEERRIAYVGMTRAEKILYVTYCVRRRIMNRYGKLGFKKSGPSEFLLQAGLL